MTLPAIIAAVLFVLSSGILFRERYRHNAFLMMLAGLLALTSTLLLVREVPELWQWLHRVWASDEPTLPPPEPPVPLYCYYTERDPAPRRCQPPAPEQNFALVPFARTATTRSRLQEGKAVAVRSGPGTDYPLIGFFGLGVRVNILGRVSDKRGRLLDWLAVDLKEVSPPNYDLVLSYRNYYFRDPKKAYRAYINVNLVGPSPGP